MNSRKRWQYAIAISMVLNIFLLCGVGILATGIFNTETTEQLLELDLLSDASSQLVTDSSQGQTTSESTGTMESQRIAPYQMVSSTSVVEQVVTSLILDEVSRDSLTDQAIDETQASSSQISGNKSGSNTVMEGVQSSLANGGHSTKKANGGILHPQILFQVNPDYPEAARQASITGTALIKVQILENGRAGDVSIKQSSGNDLLDHSAVSAIYKWRFTPAQEIDTGRAVVCYTTVPVIFRLK